MIVHRDGYKTKLETDSLIPIYLKQVDTREKTTPTRRKFQQVTRGFKGFKDQDMNIFDWDHRLPRIRHKSQ